MDVKENVSTEMFANATKDGMDKIVVMVSYDECWTLHHIIM